MLRCTLHVNIYACALTLSLVTTLKLYYITFHTNQHSSVFKIMIYISLYKDRACQLINDKTDKIQHNSLQ